MNFFKQFLRDLIGLLYPELCCACETQLAPGLRCICVKCQYSIPYTDHHLDPDNKVARRFWGKYQVDGAMALLYFRKGSRVQNIMHSLKYQGNRRLGALLGEMIGEKMLRSPKFKEIDLIIPVPLHRRKERQRGYNQSKLIAGGLAAVLGLPVRDDILVRRRATRSQARQSREKRAENMDGAFQVIKPGELNGKHILLIDDVITTGATLDNCMEVMVACGASKLSVALAASSV